MKKEECLQALKDFTFCVLRNHNGNTKFDEKSKKLVLNSRRQRQHDMLLQLINEHFDLVDKVTPKKVKNMNDHYIYETYDYDYTDGNCPNCGRSLAYDEYNRTEWCPYCGQRLLWIEDEK